MTKLFQKFLHYVNMVEEKDASNYKASRLKTRLKVDYPQLVFFAPSKYTQSELANVEAVSAGEVLDNLPDFATVILGLNMSCMMNKIINRQIVNNSLLFKLKITCTCFIAEPCSCKH